MSIEALHTATLYFIEQIERISYEDAVQLTDLREEVLNEIGNRSISADEKQLLHQIGEFDEIIVAKMVEFKDQASQEIQTIAKTRMHKKKYENPYNFEGVFVDQKE
ncbi:hypothetical protein [Paenibacillus radicis (ex Gao et al. 2016)]|uniref:Flagellar protein FliT n=1 Tax=Paenibacillus radicis (ex Gao et al. 2016) TaxID=1737354 RepID=A0A917HNY3_9BACL|nr:hypothetical protein [Paenibacillus radicis (ex Gao et al. 2016)]GGG84499.1 hypothetical protein GCM10010918_47920 [Paenibacillus radicis (ex Gao et al. 2016)]